MTRLKISELNIICSQSYFLGALVELPCWSVPVIISKLGRRWPLLVFFATSGVVGVVYGFISPEWPLTQLSVGLTGQDQFK